jgi:hypothetical protein
MSRNTKKIISCDMVIKNVVQVLLNELFYLFTTDFSNADSKSRRARKKGLYFVTLNPVGQ